MARRLTRAKAKIAAARIPYRVPTAEDLPTRVSGVLAVLFLVFNEGYLTSGADTDPIRQDLTGEAIRLTRMLRDLLPDDGEVAGLLALMLLTDARRSARVSPGGELVPLDEQDRNVWDRALVAEGHRLVRERLDAGAAPGRYQVMAAINAVHTSARTMRDTDWSQVVALYDQLHDLEPSPVVALNRAVALAELDGPRGRRDSRTTVPREARRRPAPPAVRRARRGRPPGSGRRPARVPDRGAGRRGRRPVTSRCRAWCEPRCARR